MSSDNFIDRINSLLFRIHDEVYFLTRVVAILNMFTALILFVVRYGFYLKIEEIQKVFQVFDFIFLIFFCLYLIRTIFAYRRKEYISKTIFEGSINLLIIFHGVFNYLFDVKLLLELLELLEVVNALKAYHHILVLFMLVMIGIEITKVSTKISDLNFSPASTFIFSFIFLILMGTGLLMLPAMTAGFSSMSFIDALFTSASASCVTGLAVEDTGLFFTLKGQLVIMFLIQLGGIGIVSFATFFATFLSKGVGIKQQSIIQDYLSSESLVSAKGLLRKVIGITLGIEAVGCIIIFFSWGEELVFKSFGQKLFFSAFHAVSAFCNAGFSLFSGGLYTNMGSMDTPLFLTGDVAIHKMYWLHFIVAILIILGGIGFSTLEDVFSLSRLKDRVKHPWKDWKISSKIAVNSTIILIALGTVVFMLLEFDQLQDRNIIEALNTSFFQSVTTRTAGFNTMDFGTLKFPTIIVCIFLMFIGAAPGSTGGGIKCSTFYLLLLSAIATISGQDRIEYAKRNIPSELIHKAYTVFMFSTSYNLVAVFFLSITEAGNENIGVLQIVFEQVSAFSTAGLSMGITSELSSIGKCIIILSMYLGRVGTLTLALAVSRKVSTNSYKYPDGHVMVG